jgi:phage terminase small subunit
MTKIPDLKSRGSQFWKRVTEQYELVEEPDLERLKMACGCLDEIADCERVIKKNGLFIENRYGGLIENPAQKVIRDTRLLFVRIIREMGFDLATVPESRPRRRYGG